MPGTDRRVLIRPDLSHLDGYSAALATGWSPNNLRPEAAEEERARVAEAPEALLASFEDVDARGALVTLPDGSLVERLPGIRRFIWDGGFAGVISMRWTKDGGPLPPTCLGHVGYAVVPWRRREGLATRAVREVCALATDYGLTRLEVTCAAKNVASRGVIEKAGGAFVREFVSPPSLGAERTNLYEFDVTP